VNAVAACFRADVDYRIADAFGFGEKDFFFFGDAEGKGVDKRILRIARFESELRRRECGGWRKFQMEVASGEWPVARQNRRP